MDDDHAPLLALVDRLRADVTELQDRWEALGEELEAKQRSLRLAEATVELMKRRQGMAAAAQAEGPEGGGVPRAEVEEDVSQTAQASATCVQDEPLTEDVCAHM
jgi:hypothetical protein